MSASPWKTAYKVFHRIYEIAIMLVLFSMVILVFYNVFARFVLNRSLGWIDEYARFAFIWLVFLGSFLAYEDNEHIGLDFLLERLPKGIQKYMHILNHLLVLLVCAIMMIYGHRVSLSARNISPGLGIRMTYIYYAVPVSGFLMGAMTLARLGDSVLTVLGRKPTSPGKVGS